MTIIPAGKKNRESFFGDIYEDNEGFLFVIIPKDIQQVIEANVTNGRGYDRKHDRSDKYLSWMQDVIEGHPDYSKLYVREVPEPRIPFPLNMMFYEEK
jgi:hypothetical protein